MTRFWRLDRPRGDDYRSVFVNGSVRAVHELPMTGCRSCARGRHSGRVLPVDCPESWRGRTEVTPSPRREHRVTNAEFASLAGELEPALGPTPPELGGFEPGDRFQPLLLRVPSRPEADFLWPGLGDLLVSARVRALWEAERVTGVSFARVEYERVGRRSPSATLRPRGGEPEGALNRIPVLGDTSGLQPYFAVTVTAESELPPGVDPTSVCPECARAVVPAFGGTRRIVFEPWMWRGADVTRLATTLYLVITDRVHAGLEHLGATNVVYMPAEHEPASSLPLR